MLANLAARDKIDRDIADAERQLSEALSRLSRLRQQRKKLGSDGSSLLDRGLKGLEGEEEPDSPPPMSEEQALVGQAQSLGAVGVVDWEAVGGVPYGSAGSLDFLADFPTSSGASGSFSEFLRASAPVVGQGSSGGTPGVSQGSGGS